MNNTGSPMPSSHEREQAIFTLAVAKPAAERAAFLDRECAADLNNQAAKKLVVDS